MKRYLLLRRGAGGGGRECGPSVVLISSMLRYSLRKTTIEHLR